MASQVFWKGFSPSGIASVARPPWNTGTGFFIGTDLKLYDANGYEYRIRGLNRTHYDGGSGPGIANSKANTERWVLDWENGATPSDFAAQFTTENFDNKMVAIPGVWTTTAATGGLTVTCDSTSTTLDAAVTDWVNQLSVWDTIEQWSLINIANEWGPAAADEGGSTLWRDAYISAVSTLRTAGYTHTLVIDSGSCGQSFNCLTEYGPAVFASDPQKNILFSIHVYGNIQAGQATSLLTPLAPQNSGIPLVIGEFGPGRNIGPSPTTLTPDELISAAENLGIGWMGWAWDDNDLPDAMSDDNWFAFVYANATGYDTSNPADLTIYGKDVVLNWFPLARPATIFS